MKRKIIFIANPKSGSDTLRKYLGRYGFISERVFFEKSKLSEVCDLLHMTEETKRWTLRGDQLEHMCCSVYKEYLNKYTEYSFSDFFVFSTIRNPWSRYVSAYKYANKVSSVHFSGSFDEYVNTPTFIHTRPFDFMFKDVGGKMLCHKFIDMKNIIAETPKLLFEHEIEANAVPKYANVSPNRRNYKEYYNETTKKIIENRCGETIKRFGYKFDE